MIIQEAYTGPANEPAPVTTPDDDEGASIHSRALLVSLSISTWSARKFDRKVTDEINRQHAASADAGRFNKLLLPGDATAYKALIKTSNSIRTDHYANTLAWSDEGWRLLPSANFMEYTELMRRHADSFAASLEEFLAAYPAMRDEAPFLLNGMFRAEDYPGVYELRRRFSVSLEYSPLPSSGDFRLDLPADQLDALGARVEDRVAKAARAAVEDAWTRLSDVVGKMHARLSEPGAGFRDTLVTNVADLVDTLARLNFTDDPDLEAMRQRVNHALTSYAPQDLRESADIRADVAARAAKIMADMGAVYGAGKDDAR